MVGVVGIIPVSEGCEVEVRAGDDAVAGVVAGGEGEQVADYEAHGG